MPVPNADLTSIIETAESARIKLYKNIEVSLSIIHHIYSLNEALTFTCIWDCAGTCAPDVSTCSYKFFFLGTTE